MKRMLLALPVLLITGSVAALAHVSINPLHADVRDPQGSQEDCVVLLHGLARTSVSMRGLARHLSEQGMMTVNVDYPSTQLPVAALADVAVSLGVAECRARHAQHVHFVTHSLGGILVRSYLARKTLPELGRVVMLAPPNGGSEAADHFHDNHLFHLLAGPAGMEIGTDSNSVPLLLPSPDYPLGVIAGTRTLNPWLSRRIPGPDDGKVAVSRAAIEGMAQLHVVPFTHVFIMNRKAVHDDVATFLESGRFDNDAS